MKSIVGLTLASAAIASAQAGITENYPGNQTCPKANAAYCDGESLKTNIIIRCSKAGVEGQAGNCAAVRTPQPPNPSIQKSTLTAPRTSPASPLSAVLPLAATSPLRKPATPRARRTA